MSESAYDPLVVVVRILGEKLASYEDQFADDYRLRLQMTEEIARLRRQVEQMTQESFQRP